MKKVILIDAMFTIFTPKSGLNRYEIIRKLMIEYLGFTVDAILIEKVYKDKREFWENKLPARHTDKWSVINREVILELLPLISLETASMVGKKIAEQFLYNSTFYEITADTRDFLNETARRGTKLIIASNQDKQKLEILINGFNVAHFFFGIYTSTEIGFEKPDFRFFNTILRKECLSPNDCVMIGNNPKNDVTGAENSGITGILYDYYGHYKSFSGNRIFLLNEVWSLGLFL